MHELINTEKSYKQGVSIIICFYNAGDRIVNTLKHIKAQRNRTNENTELILVNNASTDDSEAIIQQELEGFDVFPWKLVHEQKPGLAHARICGLKHVSYDVIIYCDDDNWLSGLYLSHAEQIMRKDQEIGILGGKGSAVSSVHLPNWFESVQAYYAVGAQMPESGRVIGSRNVVYGAGMVIRTKVMLDLFKKGFSFQSLGRTGTSLAAGEDSELCLAVQIMGWKIMYEETLLFEHFITPNRLSKEYLIRMQKGMGKSTFYSRFYRDYFFGKRIQITNWFWIKEIIYTILDLFKSLVRLNFNLDRHIELVFFLLKERKNYDKNVFKIIQICHQLEEK
jgi:glycosyltransferase involved in cell wall biosynthesis